MNLYNLTTKLFDKLTGKDELKRTTRRALVPPIRPLPQFDLVDTIRLHGLGVKFPESLLIEVAKKECDSKSPQQESLGVTCK